MPAPSPTNPQRRRASALPANLPPLGLDRFEAAAYVGCSPTLFDQMVRDGRMPRPKQMNGRRAWDRRQLERCFTALPTAGGDETVDETADKWDDVS